MDVLCVGQLAADILVRPVDRVDFGVDTKRVEGIDIRNGGDCLNVALGLRKLGASVGFDGLVGDDQLGDYLHGVITAAGIDARGLRRTREARTCACLVLINGKGERTFFYYGGIVLLSLGLLLILLFASDHRNWFVRLGLGLWSIYGLTGLMGDLLSYARLFGLGIATGAIAAVMNQLAGMVHSAAGPYLGGVLAVLVILIGHAFNFALALLGSTVHSARLHFVEAFKSFFEGGGVPYRPFRIEKG